MGLLNFFIVIVGLIYAFIRLGMRDILIILKFKVGIEWISLSILIWVFILWGIANLIYAIIN